MPFVLEIDKADGRISRCVQVINCLFRSATARLIDTGCKCRKIVLSFAVTECLVAPLFASRMTDEWNTGFLDYKKIFIYFDFILVLYAHPLFQVHAVIFFVYSPQN